LWRSGGKTFAAAAAQLRAKGQPQDVPLAMRSILAELGRQGRVHVLPELPKLDAPKTKEVAAPRSEALRALILVDEATMIRLFLPRVICRTSRSRPPHPTSIR
jgi:ribosomal protein L4